MAKYSTISEAPESSAGDDFHILWAARKALNLLNFKKEGLKSLSIEGVASSESERIDKVGDKLLGVDLTEYYCGEDFESASYIIISQLKYSTRNPSKNFTLSDLTKLKNSNKPDSSIIGKLANAYKVYYLKFGQEQVLLKLKLKLISNRPISDAFKEKFDKIRDFLISNEVTIEDLNTKFPKHEKLVNKVYTASNLSDSEFIHFLKILDFEDCSAGSRFFHEARIIEELNQYAHIETRQQFNSLYKLIWDKMMPEARGANGINQNDVLLSFGVGGMYQLFPVPSKIKNLEPTIKREQEREIISLIENEATKFLCLHSDGGIGKTTLITSISKQLSQFSTTIVYDCYGNGTYLDDSVIRHTPQKAFTQISNELAKEIGSPLMFPSSLSIYSLATEFKKRLEISIDILRKNDPNAILVIIIDAADNSIIAAENKGDKSFIGSLITLTELPKGCKIVFTTRSVRKDSLNLPENTLEYKISPFTLRETTEFLHKKFPNTSSQEIEEFHTLTNGIPRIQFYATHRASSLKEIFKYLRPNGKTVFSLIEEQINEAQSKIGGEKKGQLILQSLINLPRPIPIEFVSQICDYNEQLVIDFCADLSSGIAHNDGLISFRDEDFENHLRDKIYSNDNSYLVAEVFLRKVNESEYASEHLGLALFNIGRFDELNDIVLNEKYLEQIVDPIKKSEVVANRIRLALKGTKKESDKSTFLKLLVLAGEAAKIDSYRLTIINNNIGLASKFIGVSILERQVFEYTSIENFGTLYLELAVLFSRKENEEAKAKYYLKQYQGWLYTREQVPETKKYNYSISEQDIANEIETILRLYGVQDAAYHLKRWKVRKTYLGIIEILIRQLFLNTPKQQILSWFSEIKRLDLLLLLVVKLNQNNIPFEIRIEELVQRTLDLNKRKQFSSIEYHSMVVNFCEYLAQKNFNRLLLNELINSITFSKPEHMPRFIYGSYGDDDTNFKAEVLLKASSLKAIISGDKVSLNDFLPKGQNNEKRKNNSAEEESKQLYSKLIDVYNVRINGLLAEKTINDKLESTLKKINSDYTFRHHRYDFAGIYTHIIYRLLDVLPFVPNKAEFIDNLISSLEKYGNNADFKSLILIASRSSLQNDLGDKVLELLSNVHNTLNTLSLPASEKIENYLECSRIALSVNINEAEFYFQNAIEASKEIDEDAYEQIRALEYLTREISKPNQDNQKLSYEFSRFVENSHKHLEGYDHFPWEIAIEGIENLDFNTSIATICRWDHCGFINSLHYIERSVINAVKQGGIPVEQAIGLNTINLFDTLWLEFVEVIIEKTRYKPSLLEQFINGIIKDIQTICPLESREAFLKKLIPIFDSSNVRSKGTTKIKELLNFFPTAEPENVQMSETSEFEVPVKKEKNIDDLIKELAANTVLDDYSSIESALKKIKAEESYFSYNNVELYFTELSNHCSNTNICSFLDAYLNVNISLISYHSFEESLKIIFKRWGYLQIAKEWKKNNFTNILIKFTEEFLKKGEEIEYLSLYHLEDISAVFEKTKKELAIEFLTLVSDNVNSFSAKAIFESFDLFSELIGSDEAIETIQWTLERWNSDLKDDIAEGEWKEELSPPQNPQTCFAMFLKYCLGHPYKSTRWLSAHTLVRLVQYGDREIINSLFQEIDSETNGIFQSKRIGFYSTSAKLWFYFALNKISFEDPNILLHQTAIFYNEAVTRKDRNHALIRMTAKIIALVLFEHDKSIFDGEQIIALEGVYSTKIPTLNELEKQINKEDYDKRREELKFNFDELDTIRYWYEPLGDIFGLNSYEIASIAENYIYTELSGILNLKKYNLSGNDYYKTRNGHGDIPEIEDKDTYLEYHSMFYAANELFETVGAIPSAFNEWLSSWLGDWSGTWLYDHRTSTPLEEMFYNDKGVHDAFRKLWASSIELDAFSKHIGIFSTSEETDKNSDWFIVSAGYSRNWSGDSETVNISSALVKEDKAQSLLYSLQTAANNYDFKIPEESDYDEYPDEFSLKGWIGSESIVEDNENHYDNYAYHISNSEDYLGAEFEEWKASHTQLKNVSIHEVTKFENWSDINENSNYPKDFGSTGNRFSIKKEVLLSFLNDVNMALVLECEIWRYLDSRYSESDLFKERIPSNFIIYILYPNGTVKTINRSYKLR